LGPGFQALHCLAKPARRNQLASSLDSQTLAAFGAASIDDSAAAASLHAHEEAVGTGAANLGGLVSAFHDEGPDEMVLGAAPCC
jgi:hypothetical protein